MSRLYRPEVFVSHRHARLNLHGRLLLVQRVVGQRRPVAHVAKELGISRQCAHRWINRHRREGVVGLADRSSRPHRSPRRIPIEIETRVIGLRKDQRRGQDWIGAELGLPPRTVSRILRRHQVRYLTDCDPLTGQVIRSSKAAAVRYQRDRPGELVHMDVKKIGRIPDGGGWKAHGRAAARAAKAKPVKIGYDYVHSLVDDHSRLAYSEILPDETGTTCAAFLTRAARYFATHGITQVMTDNAFASRHSITVKAAVAALDARQIFIKPHCPWQNGKWKDSTEPCKPNGPTGKSSPTPTAPPPLPPWLNFYNTRRRHTALGGLPPISRLSPT